VWLLFLCAAAILATGCRKKPAPAEPAVTSDQLAGYYQAEKPDADGGHYFVEIVPGGGLQMGKRWGNSELSNGFRYFVAGKQIRAPVNVSIDVPGVKVEEKSMLLFDIRADGALADASGRVYTRATKPPPVDLTPKPVPPPPPLVIRAAGLGGEVVFRALRRQPDDPQHVMYVNPRFLTAQPLSLVAFCGEAPRRGWVTWTEANGWALWPEATTPPRGQLQAVSADGQIVVNAEDGPYLCKPGSAPRPLPPLLVPPKAGNPGNPYTLPAAATGVSGDARVVVGWSKVPGRVEGETRRAVRWVDGKPEPLPELPGTEYVSEARSVSADGQVITGLCRSGPQMFAAVRWRADGTVERLDPGNAPPPGSHLALSTADTLPFPEGVGLAGPPARRAGWAITETGHFQPHAVTADGRVMVGQDAYAAGLPRLANKYADPRHAMAWIDNGPTLSLNRLLADVLKMDMKGWQLFNATDISADGRMLVGMGFDEQGEHGIWLVTLPASWWEALPQ
jgi:hypothetical protein